MTIHVEHLRNKERLELRENESLQKKLARQERRVVRRKMRLQRSLDRATVRARARAFKNYRKGHTAVGGVRVSRMTARRYCKVYLEKSFSPSLGSEQLSATLSRSESETVFLGWSYSVRPKAHPQVGVVLSSHLIPPTE